MAKINEGLTPMIQPQDVDIHDSPNYSDFPANESVVYIDHILEQIIGSLKAPELLNCRLVSRRFLNFSQPYVKKQLRIGFCKNIRNFKSKLWRQEGKIKTLKKFTRLLDNSVGFPCVSFEFAETPLDDPILQEFLASHGSIIEELSLISKSKKGTQLTPEKMVMDQLKKKILCYVPNLISLTIDLRCNVSWTINNEQRTSTDCLTIDDPEFNDIQKKCEVQKIQNLKVLNICFPVNAKILETIIQLSPNLKEINSDVSCYKYVLSPLSRIKYIKTMSVKVDLNYLDTLEIYEKIVAASHLQQNSTLNLKNLDCVINICFWYYYVTPNGEERIRNILNRILHCSSGSLETFSFQSFKHLFSIEWPTVFPKLWKIQISYPGYTVPNDGDFLFPYGFDFAGKFPKLFDVRLFNYELGGTVKEMLKWLNLVPIFTVKRVHISGFNEEDIFLEDNEKIHGLFPSARITYSNRI